MVFKSGNQTPIFPFLAAIAPSSGVTVRRAIKMPWLPM